MESKERTAEEKYADIIRMERPGPEVVCGSHPQMSNAQRAKIFAPFAALRGHSERLARETEKTLRRRRPELSEEEMQILSDKLRQVKRGMAVSVVYFVPDEPPADLGFCTELAGRVTAFDPTFRRLRIDDTTIRFDDLLDLDGEDIVLPDRDDWT